MTSPSIASAALQKPAQPRAQALRTRRFKFLRVTGALILREITSTESRTSLGFLWQLIEPIAAIALMTLFFQTMSNKPPLGTNFPLFYVTGVMPFQIFLTVGNKVSGSVKFSKPLLEFPAVSILDAIAARFILNFLIECAVFIILASSIIHIFHVKVNVDVPMAAASLGLAGMLALGIGTFNSVLFVAYPVYETAYAVVTRPLMLISGVMFQIDKMPEPMKTWITWNPVAHPIALMRAAFFSGVDTSFISPMFIFLISLVAFTIGLVTLRSFFRDALER